MPTEHFKDVRLLEDWETQIRNTQYEFEEGDIIQVPLDLANKIINFFDVEAEGASNPYEVLEREADEKIGVRESTDTGTSTEEETEEQVSTELTAEDVEDEDDYRQLQECAQQFDDVDGSQSKEDLRDDLLERL
ncbi:MAG: hypothetical protein SVV03_02435 [Candidatus Nanohaloarchaea archaeon]|nr:hypothetical protein [Candidatus Nanohaloarchaea archaeon]